MALEIRLVNESKFILGAIFISAILILNPLAAFASEDVGSSSAIDSPDECENPDHKNEDATLNHPDSHTAPVGKKISAVCIKSGGTSFAITCGNGDKHSCLLGNGPAGLNNCYTVSDVGMQTATVTENPTPPNPTPPGFTCKAFSHIDYFYMDNGGPPGGGPVGGEFLGVDSAALLLVGTQFTAAWLFPALVAAIGIGIVLARKY